MRIQRTIKMQFVQQTIVYLFLLSCCKKLDAVIQTRSKDQLKHFNPDLSIQKVSFTQKGYIQFLRYINHVPPLTDYTFCIWVRSNNLTHSHPLLSYSKHEEERLIRVWIAPHGTDINLEILEHQLFKIPIKFIENHWYHICQSWSAYQASWNLYINGKLKSSGFEPKLKGVQIKEGGDIVVGQEYTDFDKGLDDGIEGDIFGFNFVLSSTSYKPYKTFPQRRFDQSQEYHTLPLELYKNDHETAIQQEEVPDVVSYFSSISPNRKPKGFMEFGTKLLNNVFNFFGDEKSHYNTRQPSRFIGERPFYVNPAVKKQIGPRIVNDVDDFLPKSLGLKLVELSYNCWLGKGAPISGKDVLISWTKTPVRIFGGALLKSVHPFCM